jgi:predicted O-methyltransferase YrrM
MLDILQLISQGQCEQALGEIETRFGSVPQGEALLAKAIALAKLSRHGEALASLKTLMQNGQADPQVLKLYQDISAMASRPEAGPSWRPASSPPPAPAPAAGYYGASFLNPLTLAGIAASEDTWREILEFHGGLATDDYVRYVDSFYRECLGRYGKHWHYLDIVNVLFASSKAVRPKAYLEIGVRRGRSVCTVARACPAVDVYAFDMWMPGYAGMENPGPVFVREELARNGHRGRIEFVDGDSHQTVPNFFRERPGLMLDLITVDGDHSEAGARDDLMNVIPRLAPGGVLVMDDIAHPAHPYLLKVWKEAVAAHPGLVSHEFTELGYGVAFAVKKA